VDRGVDKVCRHAGYVVRSLGTGLWKRRSEPQVNRCELRKRDPPAVRKKNFGWISRWMINNAFPQARGANLWITELRQVRPRTPPT